MKLESKVGKINNSSEQVYNFLSDFNNFSALIPQDKISDWQVDGDVCTFSVSPVGKIGFKLVEKEPHRLVKLTNMEGTQYTFKFWAQLKEVEQQVTAAKLTMEVDLNPMMQMMAKKPLKEFLDKLVDQLIKIQYPQG